VHATLADAIVGGHERFGRPFTPADRERFWGEWRAVGRLLGVRDRDLPGDWAAFRAYEDALIAERLEHTAAVDDVLAALRRPAAPRVVGRPLGHVLALVTAGMLPPVLRDRFGLGWTRGQDLELRALGRTLRSTTPVLPRAVRVSGPAYLRARRAAIERGDAARVAH
jgi:uncharacterized protein (DUF2236 family)